MASPKSYPLPVAASAAGVDPNTLKSWIQRGHMLFGGEEPRAGHARQLDLWGVYEAAFLQLLRTAGVSPKEGARQWRALLSLQRTVENLQLAREGKDLRGTLPENLAYVLTNRGGPPHIAVLRWELRGVMGEIYEVENDEGDRVPEVELCEGWPAAFDEILVTERRPMERPKAPPTMATMINLTERFTAVDQVLATFDAGRERE